jgi:general secretion pathway protein C
MRSPACDRGRADRTTARWYWGIGVALVVATAAFAAALLPPMPLSHGPRPDQQASTTLAHTNERAARPERIPITESAPVAPMRPSEEPRRSSLDPQDPAQRAAVCDTKLRLIATLHDAHRPENSRAVLGLPMPRSATLYRSGAQVDDFRLVEVHPRGVRLRRHDSSCWLRITPADRGGASASARPSKARKRARAKAEFSAHELDSGVEKLGPTSFRVDRVLLKQALERARGIARATRVRYVEHQSRPSGVRLRRIAKDGLLARLGLKRGDTVRTLNGLELTNPSGMLSARVALPTARAVSVVIERDGRPITLEYQIR